jgi:cell wall-associated NlpC family hydrolase
MAAPFAMVPNASAPNAPARSGSATSAWAPHGSVHHKPDQAALERQKPGRERQARARRSLRAIAAAVVPTGIAAAFASVTPTASASPDVHVQRGTTTTQSAATRTQVSARLAASRHHLARRLRAYYWAAHQAGHPYVWGGTGPGFDCSGLVMMAYRHVGVYLPRTTYAMLASPLLVRVAHPRMGDLAFYGSGHVELFRKWGWTFGAHNFGSPVGLIHYGGSWVPTAFYRVR